MAELFIAFVGLVLVHFIYEQILAPSFRTAIRYRMFALRDRLRALKYEKSDMFSDRAFNVINEGINTHIKLQEQIDFFMLYQFDKEKRKNSELRGEIQERWNAINACQLKEVVEIVQELGSLQTQVAVINNGGCFIYIIPSLMFAVLFAKILRGFKSLAIAPFPASDIRTSNCKPLVHV